jgi:hypothetical protein
MASGSHALFLQGAKELYSKIKSSSDFRVQSYTSPVEHLISEFESWELEPPEDIRRVQSIVKLIELTRTINELIVNSSKPS